jgi:hypothetical protein
MWVITLIGPHGVGKTTVGSQLSERLGVSWDDEIGRRLAEDRAMRPEGILPSDGQDRFDRAVFEAELDRDRRAVTPRVVETWHPGNLAYAAKRSPTTTRLYSPAAHASARRVKSGVIVLSAAREVLARRQNEPGSLDFFLAVASDAERWACRMGLPVLGRLRTDRASPEALVHQITTLTHPWRTP